MKLKHRFGKKLKAIRNSRGLTQEQLAELIDVASADVISLYELSKKFPSLDKIEKLTEVFDIDYNELLSDEEIKIPEKSKVFLALVAELNNLDDEEIAMFLGNIRAYKKLKKVEINSHYKIKNTRI